jgi:uncharacterized protein YegP (UPF0339 family)
MARSAKFEVYRSGKGWRWRLKGGNGRIVAIGESHPTKQKAERAVLKLSELASQGRARWLVGTPPASPEGEPLP